MKRLVIALVAFSMVACGGDEGETLFIDLKTDHIPGQEFVRVRTEITADVDGLVRREDFDGVAGQDFLRGTRVAGIQMPLGQHTVLVELLDDAGAVVAQRSSRISMEATVTRTMVITRDCGGVMCPLAAGDPNTSCLGGVCAAGVHARDSGALPRRCMRRRQRLP